MVLLTDHCASLLNCTVSSLRDRLNHPAERVIIEKSILGKKGRTTYTNRFNQTKTFVIGGITKNGADSVPAFGRLRRPYQINIAAYFYSHHGIFLHQPFLQCVVEVFKRGTNRFYPMELVQLVDEEEGDESPGDDIDDTGIWMKNKFSNLFMEIDADNTNYNKKRYKQSSLQPINEDEDAEEKGEELKDEEELYFGRSECSQRYDDAESNFSGW